MTMILTISIALIMGLMMTRVVKPLKLPDVTAYLIAGVFVGPYFLGRLQLEGLGFISSVNVDQYVLVSNVALGFIAFAIGNEFRLNQLKNTGRQTLIVGITQGLVAAFMTMAALLGLHLFMGDKLPVSSAITLGAIATATAPAATLMVVRQYKAKGALTDLLLPVVALDDAVALIVFAVSVGVASALNSGGFNLTSIVVEPLLEVVCSLILGSIMGWLLTQVEKLFNSNSNRLSLTIGFVFLTVALSMAKFEISGVHIRFSSLLVCMMLGTIFCNICPLSEDLMEKADRWTAPLFALFFVISGAGLELSVFTDISIVCIGVVYILFRSLGKYIGSYTSCRAAGCDETVQKYLGITLLPQAGVALGMCITAAAEFGEEGAMIRNIVLFSVLIYELVGPSLTKWALTKSGDITPQSAEVVNRRAIKLEAAAEKKKH